MEGEGAAKNFPNIPSTSDPIQCDMAMDVVDTAENSTNYYPQEVQVARNTNTEAPAPIMQIEENVKKKSTNDEEEIRQVVVNMEEEISRNEDNKNHSDQVNHVDNETADLAKSLLCLSEAKCEIPTYNQDNVEELQDNEGTDSDIDNPANFMRITRRIAKLGSSSNDGGKVNVLSVKSKETGASVDNNEIIQNSENSTKQTGSEINSDLCLKIKKEAPTEQNRGSESDKDTKLVCEYFESSRKYRTNAPVVSIPTPTEEQLYMQEQLKEYCVKELRSLELSAYSECISAMRAGGKINDEKRELLEKLRDVFQIPMDRHHAEVRRVLANDQLSVIADNATGESSTVDWKKEGYSNYHIEPKILSYHVPPEEKAYFTLSTREIKRTDPFTRIKSSGDLSSFNCVERDMLPNEIAEGSAKKGRESHKVSVAVPPNIQLNIKTEPLSDEEENEKENEGEAESDDDFGREMPTKKRKVPTKAISNDAKKRKIAVIRKSQTSPDITSSPATSPKKSISKPTQARTSVKKPTVPASSPKKKAPPQQKPDAKSKKVKPTQCATKSVSDSQQTDEASKELPESSTEKEKDVEVKIPLIKSEPEQATRGGKSRRGCGSRGGIRRTGRGSNNGARNSRKAQIPPSLATTEEMPSSPQIMNPAKPKRKVLKVKKPKVTKEQLLKEQTSQTKHRRKGKLEQNKYVDEDFEQNMIGGEHHSFNVRKQDLDNFNSISAGIYSSNPFASTKAPAKMRHKAQHSIYNEGESEQVNYNLPKYNFNEELQTHLRTSSANNNKPTSTSRIPPPIFSTSLNLNNFHKKRTQLLLPSTYLNLNNEDSGSSSSDAGTTSKPPSFITASSLAAARIRPTGPAASSVLFEQQLKQGLLSGNNVTGNASPLTSLTSLIRQSSLGTSLPLTPTPPIIHRKVQPHILSNSKRNLSAQHSAANSLLSLSSGASTSNNTNSVTPGGVTASSLIASTSNLNSNLNATTATDTSPTTTSSNTVNTPAEGPSGTDSYASVNISPDTSQSTLAEPAVDQNIENQADAQATSNIVITSSSSLSTGSTLMDDSTQGPAINLTSSIPIATIASSMNYARTPQGSNVIFVQKTLPMTSLSSAVSPVVVSNSLISSALPTMAGPLRNTSRAVILRRTTNTAPGQGNVVILDVQKNQLVNANPQFLQTARLINTQSELNTSSLLNIPSTSNMNLTTRKFIQTSAGSLVSPIRLVSQAVTNVPQPPVQALSPPRKTRAISPSPAPVTIVRSSVAIPNLKPLVAIRPVTSSMNAGTPIKVLVQSGATGPGQPPPLQVVQRLIKGFSIPLEASQNEHNGSSSSRMYSGSDNVENNIKISNVTSISASEMNSPGVVYTGNPDGSATYARLPSQSSSVEYIDGSTIQVPEGEDIFQLALKSSGIDFAQQGIYVAESEPTGDQIQLVGPEQQTGIQVTLSSGIESSQHL